MNAVKQQHHRLPLAYISALAGFVAVICPMAVLWAVGIASAVGIAPGVPLLGPEAGLFFLGYLLLIPFCLAGVLVMIVTGVPLLAWVAAFGPASRWLYVAGTSIIIGGCYLFLLFLFPSRLDVFVPLVPIAAVPSGLFLHYLAQPARSIPPIDGRDALIVATWIAAWTLFFVFMYHTPESSLDPWRRRFEIAGLAWSSGLPAFMLCGFAAGLARLWSIRLGTVVAGLAWLIPAFCVVEIYGTPLGPEKLHFAVGDRAFDIDWHLRPRPALKGFCFDASGQGLYADSRYMPPNPEICVSEIEASLVATIPSVAGERRWIEAGLNCEDVLVSGGRICSAADAAGRTATLIECSHSDCLHHFDDHGLRYSIHWKPVDFAAWPGLQERALRLVTEVSGAPRQSAAMHPLT